MIPVFAADQASHEVPTAAILAALRAELLRLAALEESRAAAEAAEVPYWAPYPASVSGHRAAAQVLRDDAQRLLATAA